MEAFEAALKRVEVVNYRQTIPLENSLVVTAYSSGFAMGSCNWTIQSPEEKICYFADSSTLNTHLSPLGKTGPTVWLFFPFCLHFV